MKHSQVTELLGRLGSEVERLEARHEAAVARSRELAEENAGLRSQLRDGGVNVWAVSPFAADRRPSLGFMADERLPSGHGLRAASLASGEPPELPALQLPGRTSTSTSPCNSPPLSVTSTPRISPRRSPRPTSLTASSPRPEPIRDVRTPPKQPAVLDPTIHDMPDVTDQETSRVNLTRRWSSALFDNMLERMSLGRASRGTEGVSERPENVARSQRTRVGAIGQFHRGGSSKPPEPVSQVKSGLLRARTHDLKSYGFNDVVSSTWFDAAFSILILLNAAVMAMEAQYRGIDLGVIAGFPGSERSAEDAWPGAERVFDVLGWIFGLMFLMEVVMKVIALKVKFVKSIWNLFDTVVVLLWLLEEVIRHINFDATIIRLGRMARLARLTRMVRTIQAFDSLQVLVGSIQASASALFWSSCLLLLIQMMVGLFLHNLLMDFMSNAHADPDMRIEVYNYFGSFSRSMISMFELTLANWPQICWTLVNGVSEWYGFIVVAYKLVVGFAVYVVVTGVFLHETFKVASSDDELMLVQKQRATNNHVKKMERLFKEADTSCDGLIDREEFKKVLMIDKVKTWLSAMELEVSDPDLLFDFLDDGDEAITVAELIDGVARLKGSARNIDLVALMHNVNKVYEMVEDVQQCIQRSHLLNLNASRAQRLTSELVRQQGSQMGLREKRQST